MFSTSVLLLGLATSELVSAQRVLQLSLYKPPVVTINGTNTTDPSTNNTSTLSPRQISALLLQSPSKSAYSIDIGIGTPPQLQTLQLDTGSSGLVVPATGSALCSLSAVVCAILGSFTSTLSATFSDTHQSVTEGFVDGASVTGDWFYDTAWISGVPVTGQLAVQGTSGTSFTQGVLGLGWPASYPTLNHNLAAQGFIASNSYSVWLDSLQSATGTILFGGVDTAKFVGPLQKVPVVGGVKNSDGSTTFYQPMVQLAGLWTTVSGQVSHQSAGLPLQAALDTGTGLSVLPSALVGSIIQAVGAMYYPLGSTSGATIIPCIMAANPNQASITFQFAAPSVTVNLAQMVLQDVGNLNGVEMCQFGLYGDDGLQPILGDSFLRSAYVVYDLDSNQIGIAQTVFNALGSNIEEIPAGGIP